MDLKQLRAKNDERAELWRQGAPPSPIEFSAIELVGEVGELDEALLLRRMSIDVGRACNEVKKLARKRDGLVGGKDDLSDIADELGDVVICADLLASSLGIDLGKAVAEKFNKTSDKHGFSVKIQESGMGLSAAVSRFLKCEADVMFFDIDEDPETGEVRNGDEGNELQLKLDDARKAMRAMAEVR